MLRVVRGDATPEEVAAVLAVFAAAGASAAAAHPAGEDGDQASIWGAHASAHRHIRATFAPSPHAWRTAFWPR